MAINVVTLEAVEGAAASELRVDEEGLKAILLNPDVKDLPVVVICVAGF